jgi:hypothetical protein
VSGLLIGAVLWPAVVVLAGWAIGRRLEAADRLDRLDRHGRLPEAETSGPDAHDLGLCGPQCGGAPDCRRLAGSSSSAYGRGRDG